MGIQADSSPFGSQTVMGPGWPNVDEDALASAAASYEALAAKISGSVVPQQQSQMMQMSEQWQGGASVAATGEATSIIAGHESHAAQAAAIAAKLRSMEVTVAKTKLLVNTTAQETQQECTAIAAMPLGNTQELVQSRIKLGLSQNIAYVTANSAELAGGLGVPPSVSNPGAPPGTAQAERAGDQGSQQMMQMMQQMGQMAMQLPQQLGGMLTQAPQQLMQPLQQLMQPLQQLMSGGGKGGSGTSLASSVAPFSSFSNHPLAGGIWRGWRRGHGEGGIAARLRRRPCPVVADGQSGRRGRRGRHVGPRRRQFVRGGRGRSRECRRLGHGWHGNDGPPWRERRHHVVAGATSGARVRPRRGRRR